MSEVIEFVFMTQFIRYLRLSKMCGSALPPKTINCSDRVQLMIIEEVGILHGLADIFVPHDFGDSANIDPMHNQIAGRRMA